MGFAPVTSAASLASTTVMTLEKLEAFVKFWASQRNSNVYFPSGPKCMRRSMATFTLKEGGPTIELREAFPNCPTAGNANAATLKKLVVVCWHR